MDGYSSLVNRSPIEGHFYKQRCHVQTFVWIDILISLEQVLSCINCCVTCQIFFKKKSLMENFLKIYISCPTLSS
jgi:hypothetical protein